MSDSNPKWAVRNGTYVIAYDTITTDTMEPGLYDMTAVEGKIVYSQVDLRNDQLLVFPGTEQDSILQDITTFWEAEPKFRQYDIPFKRGIMLWGPAGSGKSSLLRLISRDVIDRGGVVFQFTNPDLFVNGYRTFREVQPDTPIVVLLEDIDTIFSHQNESKILNLLDGAELTEKTIFLATTNYPEKMGARIMNRPSRFDRVYRVGHPNLDARQMYLEVMAGGPDIIPAGKWAKATQGLSMAHLKELFIGVHLLGGNETETINVLKGMRERHSSAEDDQIDGEVEEYAGGTYV